MDESGMRVAVVGPDEGLADAVRLAGGTVADVADADVAVAVGERAFLGVARDEPGVPLLPVGVRDVRAGVSKTHARDAVRRLLDGEARTGTHRLLGVDVAGERVGRALLDVTLVTREPARISEYAVDTDETRLGSFRADGVVVATPAGSTGYARAIGGPVLLSGAGTVVVPIAPFTIDADSWVVSDAVTITVRRDDEPVALVLDDETWGDVSPHEPIRVRVDGEVELVSVPTPPGGQ